jgi:uncharacterized membrane protein YqjE
MPHDTSISALLKGILNDIQALLREEIALARVELGEHASRARAAAMSFGIAIAALAFGGTFLLIALALGIADAMTWPAWAGFLVVAVLLCVSGAVAYFTARRRLTTVHMVPEETVTTLKENSAWIAKRLSSEPR